MDALDCAEFMHWSLPLLRLRPEGYRRVRKQVCRRISRRITELGLPGFSAYRKYLEHHFAEWSILDALCTVTISRFYRDRRVFDRLRAPVLPELARSVIDAGGSELRCWSAGCASGEEPYTLQMLWKASVLPALGVDLPLQIIATDTDGQLLERARLGRFRKSTLRDLPEEFRECFTFSGDSCVIHDVYRQNILFVRQDIRQQMPVQDFHLMLCRNLVFTYFAEDLQQEILERMLKRLLPGGVLVIGIHESLPAGHRLLENEKGTGCYLYK